MKKKFTLRHNLPLIGIGIIFVLLIVLFAFSQTDVNFSGNPAVSTSEDAAEFLRGLGWKTSDAPLSVKEVEIPAEFDSMYSEYNDLQKQQGFDLSRYRSKTATMYTFKVLNHPDDSSDVFANVLVYKGKVIAGDVVSYALDGFLEPLTRS